MHSKCVFFDGEVHRYCKIKKRPKALEKSMVVAVALVTIVMMVIVVMAAAAVVVIVIMLVAAAAVIMMMIVVITVGAGVLRKDAGQQLGNRFVRRAGDAGVERDISVIQRDLRAHADAAADERIHAELLEHTGEGAVSAAGDRHDALGHLAVFDFINLELLRMAEVLEDLTVFVGDCNFLHNTVLLKNNRIYILIIHPIWQKSSAKHITEADPKWER